MGPSLVFPDEFVIDCEHSCLLMVINNNGSQFPESRFEFSVELDPILSFSAELPSRDQLGQRQGEGR